MSTPDRMTAAQLTAALTDPDGSTRMRAALNAGTCPEPEFLAVLIERCAVDDDFYVRDTLTWALTRHSSALTVPRLITELGRDLPQARSQALHTLSKIGDPSGWPAITPELLRDPDQEVARAAWRAAVVLVPADGRAALAAELCRQLARGDRDMQRSLSRALMAVGDAATAALAVAVAGGTEPVATHALATLHLIEHPDDAFDSAVFEAQRHFALQHPPDPSAPPPSP